MLFVRLVNIYKKKYFKVKISRNISEWMQMSKDERKVFDDYLKENSSTRKKLLLNQIRQEYQAVRKNHQNKSRPPFKPKA